MHCRSSYPTNNIPQCSSFLFIHTNKIKPDTYSCSSYNNQIKNTRSHHCRRRLEDPIITYASNYYATYSQQILHSPPPTRKSSSLLTTRRFHQKSTKKDDYCDLYNLLENSPSVKPKKTDRCDHHHSLDYKETDIKSKKLDKRTNRPRKTNCQGHLSSKGFFRRITYNYFCMLKTNTDGDISS